jgi:hypothetical protein
VLRREHTKILSDIRRKICDRSRTGDDLHTSGGKG